MKEILENNPKCTELIRNYYRTTFLNNFKSHLEPDEIQEYFTKMNLGIDELATLVESNPIYLVYMFDEHKFNIFFSYMIQNNETEFFYTYKDIDTNPVKLFKTRKECEKEAIIQAIKLLEEGL